jgi:hypothetical protein
MPLSRADLGQIGRHGSETSSIIVPISSFLKGVHVRWTELTINSSNLAAEAVGVIVQDAAGGFTIRNTSQGAVMRAWLPENEELEGRIEGLRQRFANLPEELLE